MPLVSDSPRKKKKSQQQIQLHSAVFTLLPGSTEAFVPSRIGWDGAGSLASWARSRGTQMLFSQTAGQQSRCLTWAAQLLPFPGKHAQADACKKKPIGWVTRGPWCFLKLSRRCSAALQAAGAMSAASQEPQRSVIKLLCLWQFLLRVASGDFRVS